MTSITAIPTGEHLFVARSEEVLGGLKLGVRLQKGVEVSVHLERAQGMKLAEAMAALCGPGPGRRRRRTRRSP